MGNELVDAEGNPISGEVSEQELYDQYMQHQKDNVKHYLIDWTKLTTFEQYIELMAVFEQSITIDHSGFPKDKFEKIEKYLTQIKEDKQ